MLGRVGTRVASTVAVKLCDEMATKWCIAFHITVFFFKLSSLDL